MAFGPWLDLSLYSKRKLMTKALLISVAVLFVTSCQAPLRTAHAKTNTDWQEWQGSWQDCYSHNFPDRPACVGRGCEGNWPGPKDQCSPKAQSPRWLKRAEAQRDRCRHKYFRREVTYKGINRYERCMQRFRDRHKLGKNEKATPNWHRCAVPGNGDSNGRATGFGRSRASSPQLQ